MEEMLSYKLRILQKAHDLFLQYGVRGVSMDDIAAELGASKKTIYQHYDDKNSLVQEVIEAQLAKNCEDSHRDRELAENAIHEGFLAIKATAELFKNMIPSLMHDLKKYHPKAYKKFLDYKGEYLYNELKQNIDWGIKDGLYREDINIEVMARFRVESIMVTFSPEFYSKVNTGLAAIHEELFYLFLYGMATLKGNRLISQYKKQKNKKLSNAKA